MINDRVIRSFMTCNYKAYRVASNDRGAKTEYEVLELELLESARARYYSTLKNTWGRDRLLVEPVIAEIPECTVPLHAILPSLRCATRTVTYDAMELLPRTTDVGSLSLIPAKSQII